MEAWAWGAAGVGLALVELALPGFFLIFVAIGAFVVGAVLLVVPLSFDAALAVFAGATVLAAAGGFRVYRGLARGRDDASTLNRPDRLIGAQGTVEDKFHAGRGKVRLGDTVWLARGPDLAKGVAVAVTAVDGTVLVVEAVVDAS